MFHDQGKKIVLATGVFDVLHEEHVNFLKKAKAAGDVLAVGIESDVRVRQIKGEARPVNSQAQRSSNLRDLNLIDLVFILPEQFSKPADHKNLIEVIKPSVLAVSSHTKHLREKEIILKQNGGRVKIVHQHNPDISTSKLVSHGLIN